jgi:hypothetical protein
MTLTCRKADRILQEAAANQLRWRLFQPIPLFELSLEERLRDAPRSGKKPRLTAEQICAIVAMACEAPGQSGRPITHWTNREIADEIVKRGIVDSISPRHAARILKKQRSVKGLETREFSTQHVRWSQESTDGSWSRRSAGWLTDGLWIQISLCGNSMSLTGTVRSVVG